MGRTFLFIVAFLFVGFLSFARGRVIRSGIRKDSELYEKLNGLDDYSMFTNRPNEVESRSETKTERTLEERVLKPRIGSKQYTKLTFSQIENQLKQLANNYPDFVTLSTSQDSYGLPSACGEHENLDWKDGCVNSFIIIEDKKMYEKEVARKAKEEIPDVFLSGEVHGDERVAPVAMVETAKLLVQAAACEAGVGKESLCDNLAMKYDQQTLTWLARLVSTRRIVIVPTANAKGYAQNRREEMHVNPSGKKTLIDPNRDFAFDRDSTTCMSTIAARTINELFLDNLFQMAVTYHGGIELIGYEWGALSIPWFNVSPDDNSQHEITKAMSQYAGELRNNFGTPTFYQTGDMNSILYGVYGGMEDWAYAGSWYSDLMTSCNPSTYGGYSEAKTNYDDATLRTFNILVETSTIKDPASDTYGTDMDLLNGPFEYDGFVNNGYASKHIRTALMSIDIVQPYVEIHRYRNKNLGTELKPLRSLKWRWCKWKKRVWSRNTRARIHWNVGGSYTVDETRLLYGKWDDFKNKFNGINQMKEDDINRLLNDKSGKFFTTPKQSGGTRWSNEDPSSIPTFSATVKLSHFSKKDNVAVYAIAKVDQGWKLQNSIKPVAPQVGPQSHMVNARTNPTWRKEKPSIGKVVQGRLRWLSVPLTIVIA